MELIDTSNPAVKKFTDLDPRAIEEIHDDPANAAALYRTMAVINDYEIYTMREQLTPAQRMEASANWRKAGGLEHKQQAESAGGVSITINMPNRNKPPITVEGTALELPEEADARDSLHRTPNG